jgi:predicted neuraminidase
MTAQRTLCGSMNEMNVNSTTLAFLFALKSRRAIWRCAITAPARTFHRPQASSLAVFDHNIHNEQSVEDKILLLWASCRVQPGIYVIDWQSIINGGHHLTLAQPFQLAIRSSSLKENEATA